MQADALQQLASQLNSQGGSPQILQLTSQLSNQGMPPNVLQQLASQLNDQFDKDRWPPDIPRRLIVCNLPSGCTAEDLGTYFEKFDEVAEANLFEPGIGYANMRTFAGTRRALESAPLSFCGNRLQLMGDDVGVGGALPQHPREYPIGAAASALGASVPSSATPMNISQILALIGTLASSIIPPSPPPSVPSVPSPSTSPLPLAPSLPTPADVLISGAGAVPLADNQPVRRVCCPVPAPNPWQVVGGKDELKRAIKHLPLESVEAKEAYFVMRTSSVEDIVMSRKLGAWGTSEAIEQQLCRAQEEGKKVTLFFSLLGSGEFCGFGVVVGDVVSRQDATDTAPGLGKKWSYPFKLQWVKTCSLPFKCTDHLLNPLNDGKPLRNSRDGQELPVEIGRELIKLISTRGVDRPLERPDRDRERTMKGAVKEASVPSGAVPEQGTPQLERQQSDEPPHAVVEEPCEKEKKRGEGGPSKAGDEAEVHQEDTHTAEVTGDVDGASTSEAVSVDDSSVSSESAKSKGGSLGRSRSREAREVVRARSEGEGVRAGNEVPPKEGERWKQVRGGGYDSRQRDERWFRERKWCGERRGFRSYWKENPPRWRGDGGREGWREKVHREKDDRGTKDRVQDRDRDVDGDAEPLPPDWDSWEDWEKDAWLDRFRGRERDPAWSGREPVERHAPVKRHRDEPKAPPRPRPRREEGMSRKPPPTAVLPGKIERKTIGPIIEHKTIPGKKPPTAGM